MEHTIEFPMHIQLALGACMSVSLYLQPQHSHTLQYIPLALCLHFAADKALQCIYLSSAYAICLIPAVCCYSSAIAVADWKPGGPGGL